ncbi:IclR family transcriptional regulator [Pseudohoeflea coraliihabitans]|uniref:IclR family transcriptional regulator n=1 Tax=Pseudohoeflea coraliihabitans TaxID=2860393 RepID=A0ABS6WJB2_9HYPH|nr:IclR family transcriptional regulator [Pseudohoeflea sp. DP4N28-3]MBW3096031.1 IclR family transcriptional regulator [Pseudohoeflea sp. DP4N28-3]
MSQIERCLDILESLHQAPGGYALSNLAEKLSMPKSAVHRLMITLRDRGYVEQDPDTDLYRATLKLSLIGAKYFSTTNLKEFLKPVIADLSAEAGELARLSLLIGEELIWVLSSQGGEHTLRYDGHSGRAVVPHLTATGRIWLASMSDEQAVSIALSAGLGDPRRRRPGTKGVATVQQFLKELQLTRERGFGLVEEEAEIGVSSVACAIEDLEQPGRFVGAVSIAGPSVRLTRKRMKALVPGIEHAAASLATVLYRYRVYINELNGDSLAEGAGREELMV